MTSTGWARCCRAALALVAIATLGTGGAEAASLFATADASAVIVRGKVAGITDYPTAKLQVFRLQVSRVLKGEVAVGEPMDLAQEMLFATTKPFFTEGTETLVFAVPLPDYSSFREALPEGRYWRWTERLASAPDLAPLTDPVLTDAVARYLAVRDDAEATADFVVDAIRGASPRVRADALEVVVSRRDVAVLLDARRLEPLAGWLRDANVSPLEKSNVLVRLARRQAPGLGDIARPLADAAGPLQAAAIDALITIDQPPPPERLLALSRLPDEPLRLVTGRGLAKLGTPEAITRLSELFGEPISASVRIAIIQGFGRTANPRVTEMLARELARPEKDVAMAAAEGLVQQGSDEAIAVLAKTLEEGRPDSKMASAFALKRMNRAETDEILENLERTSPDPEVRRLCKLALGESMHEH